MSTTPLHRCGPATFLAIATACWACLAGAWWTAADSPPTPARQATLRDVVRYSSDEIASGSLPLGGASVKTPVSTASPTTANVEDTTELSAWNSRAWLLLETAASHADQWHLDQRAAQARQATAHHEQQRTAADLQTAVEQLSSVAGLLEEVAAQQAATAEVLKQIATTSRESGSPHAAAEKNVETKADETSNSQGDAAIGERTTKLYPLWHVTSDSVDPLVRRLLTPGVGDCVSAQLQSIRTPVAGSSELRPREALLVRDRAAVIEQIDRLISELDTAPWMIELHLQTRPVATDETPLFRDTPTVEHIERLAIGQVLMLDATGQAWTTEVPNESSRGPGAWQMPSGRPAEMLIAPRIVREQPRDLERQ